MNVFCAEYEHCFHFFQSMRISVIKSMKKSLKTLLPDNIKTDVAFQGKQLSFCFKIKDKTQFPHKHDLVCHAECPVEKCNDDYVSKMARCISENVIGHSERDRNSHILKYQIKKEHPSSQYQNFKIISSGFRKQTNTSSLNKSFSSKAF